MCKTIKEVWHTLIITHQGNSQVKNCKIDLLTQEYEKFSILNEENIDRGFTRFNAIVTSLKSLDPNYSSKNYIRKFFRAIPLKWRAKLTAIEEAKYLTTLLLDELVGKLKVYELILENDGTISKTTAKEKVKPLSLKVKVTRKQTSDDNDRQGGSDEAFNLMTKNFRKFFRKGNRFGRSN
nr:UBN2 domain-containing protein [Tanacetum cinerariifolium]